MSSSLSDNRNGQILIVEDDPNVRRSLGRVLRLAGCEITSACSGEQALQYLEEADYDLVYLDVLLPGMDGLEVLRKLRENSPDLAVIFLTAHASLHLAKEALRLGAEDYLTKPIYPEVLISKTKAFLAEKLNLRSN